MTVQAKYRTVKYLNLPAIEKEILDFWESQDIFHKSIESRKDAPNFVFYEGPPSVNGMPGIHHVMARTLKDLFCRFQTLKGKKVGRKAGWDTHGLPMELGVEKSLGITKEDIGKKISVEEYNALCRKEAMRYIDKWNDITKKMGYWVDMENPYTTYDTDYIETLWYLLKQLYNKGLLYKGYTIQPYSPAAGTGLSSHELNQPGCYREVTDQTATAQFKIIENEQSQAFFAASQHAEIFFLAWTTTPWTLPSNTALAVGKKVDYVQIDTFNPYTSLSVSVILAENLVSKYFKAENEGLDFATFEKGNKAIPYKIVAKYKGTELEGARYEQLMPYVQPTDGDAFRVIIGDFVTTTDGTGIVHIAPSFGADDMRMSKIYGLGSLTLVDKRGRFVEAVTDFANRPVKNYDKLPKKEYIPVDRDIVIKLKTENRAFNAQKYKHSYPHCWRTDMPIVYYPLDSWFVKTTAYKERMVELNKTINWQPAHTGEGRFGNWLENLVDWNLSRSRFWGVPLPIWRTEDNSEELCIGSVQELKGEIAKAVSAGFMDSQIDESFDLHKPYVDNIILISPLGQKMYRQSDLIDVWFDSGAMPYAQWHFPFENKEQFKANFPADFIAEGVDQTRGWFFTLHAIAVMLFDSVAYKNVISTGLLLDKTGVKMSKRLGNVVNPFEAIDKYGADANRWYMMTNSQPWDNLRFDLEGVKEVQRKFFGTLFNTYSFFTLYANVDGFQYSEARIPVAERPEIDRWIMSLLHSLSKAVDESMSSYSPTQAGRLIQEFVTDNLSNWYVRLCRRRFWKGEYNADKIAAYQTLYECMETVAQLMSPIAPFFSDFLFKNLNNVTQRHSVESVHLSYFPKVDENSIDALLEERMKLSQDISSMVLALRKKEKIKVRQPLQKILIPILDEKQKLQIEKVADLILSETNIKAISYVSDNEDNNIIKKNIKPDFRKLGRKLGKNMKAVGQMLAKFSQNDIKNLEKNGSVTLDINGQNVLIAADEVVIASEDIEGWLVNSMNGITVALDISITDELAKEGTARELVKALQTLRKEQNLNITDRIRLQIGCNDMIEQAIQSFESYIATETLAVSLELVEDLPAEKALSVTINEVVISLTMEVV